MVRFEMSSGPHRLCSRLATGRVVHKKKQKCVVYGYNRARAVFYFPFVRSLQEAPLVVSLNDQLGFPLDADALDSLLIGLFDRLSEMC
jgi:hypothetical protein